MTTVSRFIILITGLLFCSPAVWAESLFGSETLSVGAIVESANCVAYYQGRDGRADMLIVITDSNGNERKRQATMVRLDTDLHACGEQKAYVYFYRPADLNKTSYLVWKHADKHDDRWLYLPALDLVKRIAPSDERTSFVGSHFFYEDVTGRSVAADTHELVEVTDKYYVIKNVPKDPKSVEFFSWRVWIDRSNFIPVKAVYMDGNNEKYRTYEALNVEVIQGYPTVTRARIVDSKIGGETVVTFSDISYNVGVEKKIFAERYLRKPPRKFIK